MMKKTIGFVFFLVILSFACSPPSAAQTPPSCLVTTTWWFPLQIPLGWFYYGPYPGTYTYVIAAKTAKCPPPPPPSRCPGSGSPAGVSPATGGPMAGNPICLANGDTFIAQTDVRIPGLGGGLSLARTWGSVWPVSLSTFQSGIFGPNWRSTYEERIVVGADSYLRYVRGDGTFWAFGVGGSSTNSWVVSAPANIAATLSTNTNTNSYYTLTLQNGEQRRFDPNTGNLIAIIDHNGNTTTVAYDSSGRLSTVTDPASRTLTFNYTGSSTLVTSVSSSVGISLSYTYDTQGRLIQVTKPDQTAVSFAYNSQSLITAVTDSNGKTLESHTYDSSNRGLTSVRANGVDAVTITYPH